MYETFEHTADLGLRIRAASLQELFADAARALFSVIVANLEAVRPVNELSFDIPGEASEYLLFDWLSELLFAYETKRMVLAEFDVHLREGGLAATARGEPIDPARHRLDHEVKAITYHGLKLIKENGGWLAEVIVDI